MPTETGCKYEHTFPTSFYGSSWLQASGVQFFGAAGPADALHEIDGGVHAAGTMCGFPPPRLRSWNLGNPASRVNSERRENNGAGESRGPSRLVLSSTTLHVSAFSGVSDCR